MTDFNQATVLLVEDSPSLSRVYREYLRNEPYRLEAVETGQAAMASLSSEPPDAILLDLKLPDMHGMDILRHVASNKLPTAVVVITAHGSISAAVDAMRDGAHDFLVKPFTAERLIFTLRNALHRKRLERIVETYEEDTTRANYCGFIGASPAMQAIYRVIESAARSKATVFITGESGTGKELCAEAVHRQSPRSHGPFVAINCGAIPKDLMESEVFGHIKGAFTGASADREGAASRADGGTLFLDEICEMDMNLQTKMLRFIQTGCFERVGGDRTQQVDVRFVCATNQDPHRAVAEGRLREDLFYRLHVIPIAMPPLRARKDDVLLVARAFLDQFAEEEGKKFNAFDPAAEAILLGYDWPGNVRQLQNAIRNIVVLHDAEIVTPDMLPPPINAARPSGPAVALLNEGRMQPSPPVSDATAIRPLWETEKAAIERAIALCDGNIPKAAGLLGISASTIYRKKLAWSEDADGDSGARRKSILQG